MNKPTDKVYDQLIDSITTTFVQGQKNTFVAINTCLVMTYWHIGQHIIEFEQQGETSAKYGQQLLSTLSRDLKLKHGKGFSVSNLQRFRQFYLLNKNHATVSHKLSWSHHVELLKISEGISALFLFSCALLSSTLTAAEERRVPQLEVSNDFA
ncbi:DUF1016 N-terminal domain-containing protein [Shewanella surugensis]|uniref:DUF1016 N-terminal domain-containing protein n=1 Tax=Shewanella surugensis TaxID=212020 RepID=A0ABT0LDL0_9GAMM|nr:DUF1016 N-terminal domain-containing protein [Shewanella surugensis]MCL1125793.1 DUF1016 N-terminal domain-containing protein [Shewanella surugensis]